MKTTHKLRICWQKRCMNRRSLLKPKKHSSRCLRCSRTFLHEFGWEAEVQPLEAGLFIAGRAARLVARKGEERREVGWLGEVHPAVLERFNLIHPVALMEIDLTTVTGLS